MTGSLDLAEALVAYLTTTDLEWLELTGPDGHLRLVRRGTSFVAEAAEPTAADAATFVVRALGPGQFLLNHPLRNAPLVEIGAEVRANTVIGLLRVGSLLIAVTAPVDGIVMEVLAEDGVIVGYGTDLFVIETEQGEDAT